MSDKPNHTPGPWFVVTDFPYADEFILGPQVVAISAIEDDMTDPIAWMSDVPVADEPTMEANAKILAAAPEMFALLKRASDVYRLDARPADHFMIEIDNFVAQMEGREP